MPFDLLSQPFCWLTFSHWTTNSVNCRRASHTNEKPGTAALFVSQKPGCLQWSQTQWTIELMGFSVHRSDRTKELTGKSRGGGVCCYINNLWCDERNLHSIKSFCSPDLEFNMLLCRPFWLPREFTAIIIMAVYIPPSSQHRPGTQGTVWNIIEQETAHPDAAFVVMGDFNKARIEQ